MKPLEKELPNAPDAERAILGAVLLNPELALDAIAKSQKRGLNPTHRQVFSAIAMMLEQGQTIDAVLLAAYLRDEGRVPEPLSTITNPLSKGALQCSYRMRRILAAMTLQTVR